MERTRGQASGTEVFFPHGAVAFFIAMLAFYAVLWVTLFLVMRARG